MSVTKFYPMKKQIIFLKIGILILLSPFELKNKQYQGKLARIFLKIEF